MKRLILATAIILSLATVANAHTRRYHNFAEGLGHGLIHMLNSARPHAWCGWYMRSLLGVSDPSYNLARNWVGYGRPAMGPHVGAIVVWPHHVSLIVGRTPNGVWITKGGNEGGRVMERPRSLAGAIAFRDPS